MSADTMTQSAVPEQDPSWAHFRLERRTPSYWRVTFDHPPINTITATTVAELAELVDLIERASDLNVIVFESANPDCFLAHCDTENAPERTLALPVGPTGMNAWLDLLVRLSRAPAVSIASIRGRARGAGSEFVLACDMRFASRENALLGQFEVGLGLVPGGGPMARLARLAGRGRALEIVLVGDDFDGARAELYGYVNRAVQEAELDSVVHRIAARAGWVRARGDRPHQELRRRRDAPRRPRVAAGAGGFLQAERTASPTGLAGERPTARAEHRRRSGETAWRACRGGLARSCHIRLRRASTERCRLRCSRINWTRAASSTQRRCRAGAFSGLADITALAVT
jgi:enoyl-CoA hydratase/carnithine racemase